MSEPTADVWDQPIPYHLTHKAYVEMGVPCKDPSCDCGGEAK